MDALAVVRRRLYDQRLAADPFERPRDAVRWLGAVQAQEFAEAKWSIGQRVRDCSDADVEQAFARGEILRTHVLRPTWHFAAADDIRWMLNLTAPRVHAVNRYWYAKHDLDESVLARGHEVLSRALDGGEPLTRKELADALARAGIAAEGPRLAYLVMHAELEALVCSGPRRGAQHAYLLLEDRAPQAPEVTRDQALAELTRRYFRSHGPATVKDFTWWSGLTAADARAGLEAVGRELMREVDDGGTSWISAPAPAPRCPLDAAGAFLLPGYDEAVIAYKDLKIVLADSPPREGLLARPIVLDGRTVGSWKRTTTKRAAVIGATLFTSLNAAETQALQAAVQRFGRFLELPATLEIDDGRS